LAAAGRGIVALGAIAATGAFISKQREKFRHLKEEKQDIAKEMINLKNQIVELKKSLNEKKDVSQDKKKLEKQISLLKSNIQNILKKENKEIINLKSKIRELNVSQDKTKLNSEDVKKQEKLELEASNLQKELQTELQKVNELKTQNKTFEEEISLLKFAIQNLKTKLETKEINQLNKSLHNEKKVSQVKTKLKSKKKQKKLEQPLSGIRSLCDAKEFIIDFDEIAEDVKDKNIVVVMKDLKNNKGNCFKRKNLIEWFDKKLSENDHYTYPMDNTKLDEDAYKIVKEGETNVLEKVETKIKGIYTLKPYPRRNLNTTLGDKEQDTLSPLINESNSKEINNILNDINNVSEFSQNYKTTTLFGRPQKNNSSGFWYGYWDENGQPRGSPTQNFSDLPKSWSKKEKKKNENELFGAPPPLMKNVEGKKPVNDEKTTDVGKKTENLSFLKKILGF
jgi:myosin heavy subunit